MLTRDALAQLKTWNDSDLIANIPAKEDANYEFKSSRIDDNQLRLVIQKAASGFWNSGGGTLVIGVNEDTGKPDGGVTTHVGRTSRQDWIDKAISAVAPFHANNYCVQEIGKGQEALAIDEGRAVYVVGFSMSDLAPHMAPDGRYYLRAGAHTEPASAFLVESLLARRGRLQPQLRLQFRRDPILENTLQLGIVNVSSTPAIDVRIKFEHPPQGQSSRAIARANVIDSANPLYIDYLSHGLLQTEADKILAKSNNNVEILYRDNLLNEYTQNEVISSVETNQISLFDGSVNSRIAGSLQHIVNALCRLEVKLPELLKK